MTEDVVNRPAHYTRGKIEVIDFIEDQGLGFCLGNAVKYVARAGHKDPSKYVEDLKKAVWYIVREIENRESPKSMTDPGESLVLKAAEQAGVDKLPEEVNWIRAALYVVAARDRLVTVDKVVDEYKLLRADDRIRKRQAKAIRDQIGREHLE